MSDDNKRLRIFIGHSEDARPQAERMLELRGEFERALDRDRTAAPTDFPFDGVELFEWKDDGDTRPGGQIAKIDPAIARAHVGIFIFNNCVGDVTRQELDAIRSRVGTANPPHLLVCFPKAPIVDLQDSDAVQNWQDVLTLKQELLRDWTADNSRAVQPLDDYADDDELARNVLVQFKDKALPRILAAARNPLPPEISTPDPDFTPYLEHIAQEAGVIDLAGVGSEPGRVQEATQVAIENIYTGLRARGVGFSKITKAGVASVAGRAALNTFEAGPIAGAVTLLELVSGGGSHPVTHFLPNTGDRLLIEGQPGSGKSTFLKLVAAMLASDRVSDSPTKGGDLLGLAPERGRPIPILMRLDGVDFGSSAAFGAPHWEVFLDTLTSIHKAHRLERDAWEARLEAGDVILLFDSLDEVTDPNRRQRVFDVLKSVAATWTQCPIVVASRPIDTHALTETGFQHIVLEPFGRTEIREFVDHWVAALRSRSRPETVAKESQVLFDALAARPSIRRMAANPVMLTCLCVVHWHEGRLPDGRARLYRSVIRWLIRAREERRRSEGYSERFAEEAFSELALNMMGPGGSKQTQFDLEDAATAVRNTVSRHFSLTNPAEIQQRAKAWLQFEAVNSGICEEIGTNRFRFWHLTFQEYLAALALARKVDGEPPANESPDDYWWPQIKAHLEDAQWRETTAMLAPCLFDEGGGVRVDRLAEHILNTAQAPDTNQLEHQARLAGLVGRILVPMDTYGYKARADIAERYRGLLNSVLPLFEEAKASVEVSAEARVAAAEALGRAGDPRLESNRFITVPNTQVALGRYPVTVQDYLPFVEAGGYENSEWWSPLGWQTRHDNGWREPDKWAEQLQHQTRPVIYVSYFEAEAFCGWLTVELGRRCWLPDGDEWSAIAERGRAQFPWGDDEPTDQHANFRHRHGGCTPVGCFPLGDGSFGHGDVAGNVWEWTAEVHEPTDDETKAWGKEIIWFKLRGGGWGHPAEDLASAIRIRSRAEDRYSGVGFRVASALDD